MPRFQVFLNTFASLITRLTFFSSTSKDIVHRSHGTPHYTPVEMSGLARALAIALLLQGIRVVALDAAPSSTSGPPVTVGCIALDYFDYGGAKQVDISQDPTASACGVSGSPTKRNPLGDAFVLEPVADTV